MQCNVQCECCKSNALYFFFLEGIAGGFGHPGYAHGSSAGHSELLTTTSQGVSANSSSVGGGGGGGVHSNSPHQLVPMVVVGPIFVVSEASSAPVEEDARFTVELLIRCSSTASCSVKLFRNDESQYNTVISPFVALSQRGLNPIKLMYDPGQPDGRLNFTPSAFNQLNQYISSPGRMHRCKKKFILKQQHVKNVKSDRNKKKRWETLNKKRL